MLLVERYTEAVPKVVTEDPPESSVANAETADTIREDLRTGKTASTPYREQLPARHTVGVEAPDFHKWSMNIDAHSVLVHGHGQ
jgi:hypothetical protein